MGVICIKKSEHDGNKTTVGNNSLHLIIFKFESSVIFVCIEWKLFPYWRIRAHRERYPFLSRKAINKTAKFPVGNASQVTMDKKNKTFDLVESTQKPGCSEVYFFITDSVFLPEILIPDLKNVENFDLWSPKCWEFWSPSPQKQY